MFNDPMIREFVVLRLINIIADDHRLYCKKYGKKPKKLRMNDPYYSILTNFFKNSKIKNMKVIKSNEVASFECL